MFEGFVLVFVDTGEATLRVRHGGSGPPVLLHGHPRTHATWHHVAPMLADRHTLVCPDLRGYGQSSKPATTSDHEPYSWNAALALTTSPRQVLKDRGHHGRERQGGVTTDRRVPGAEPRQEEQP